MNLTDQTCKITSSFRISYNYDEQGRGIYKIQVLFKYGLEFTGETYRLTANYILPSVTDCKIYITSKSEDMKTILGGYTEGYLISAKVEQEDLLDICEGSLIKFIGPCGVKNFLKNLIVNLIDIDELYLEFSPTNFDYSLDSFCDAVKKLGISIEGYRYRYSACNGGTLILI